MKIKLPEFPLFIVFLFLLSGCNRVAQRKGPAIFSVLEEDRTGIRFINKLTPTDQFNVFHYMYYYNGAGIGAGDFNHDGKIDLFFASNQGANKLFLNQGNMKFKDASAEAGITNDGGWSTGVSVADVNNDGLLDIYICRVGNYEVLKSKNQLLICQGLNKDGVPVFKDEAAQYGLDFSGFSTQAAFFDFDGDGDLDMFLLNHSVHQNGMFANRKNFLGTYNPLSGDRLFRNDGNRFTDITHESQINSSAISYGLGISVSDIDLDGYPDLYIGNDFHENDYLYINQHNGTFKEENNDRIMHTSKFSMGVDVADINNDAYPDIISMDMLPSDPYILRRSFGEDDYDVFYQKISAGYNYQYSRNNLQLNRRNGMFSEVGLYAGIAATDWSWAPLWIDFDNDGLKDLFISNGIPKRLTDIDYLNYVSNSDIQQKINDSRAGDGNMSLIDKFPQIKLPNKFFRNNGDVTFGDETEDVEGNLPTYSNGAVYADLDNDGDLDIVVNNIDAPVLIYENKANDQGTHPALEIKLDGPDKNRYAVGSKVLVYEKNSIRTYEKFAARGFMSSMETPVHVGMYHSDADSILLVWPDNTYEKLDWHKGTKTMTVSYKKGLPSFDYQKL
ncbi:MAG TPA: CRTAC1 family protein, partial [Flavisolibacter sp.]|nr:CRTAC1 family protein [Flavisolibacter sp.]